MTLRRFRSSNTRAPDRGINVGVQLKRRAIGPKRERARGQGVPGCTPAIGGIEWCVFTSAINPLTVDGNTYTMGESTETPVCSTDDATITVSGGYLPSEQAGTWVFRLTGETCGCEPIWTYVFEKDPESLWNEIPQPIVCGTSMIFVVPSPGIGGAGYAEGVATITATCNGVTYGPFLITIAAGGGY